VARRHHLFLSGSRTGGAEPVGSRSGSGPRHTGRGVRTVTFMWDRCMDSAPVHGVSDGLVVNPRWRGGAGRCRFGRRFLKDFEFAEKDGMDFVADDI
jgi:hypothetical protein